MPAGSLASPETRLSDRVGLSLGSKDQTSDDGNRRTLGEASVSVQTSDVTKVEAGVTHRDEAQVGDAEDTGQRTDLGLKLTRDLSQDQSLYLFGQTTVARSGGIRRNDRIGVGLDARALLDFRPTAADRLYPSYELDPNHDIAGTRATDAFTADDAGLLALRATHAFDCNWEIKVGLGDNFGAFSDDLRDTTLDDPGLFPNLQAKF